MRILMPLVVVSVAVACSDSVSVEPMDIIAGPIAFDGPSNLWPGDSLQVRVVSIAGTRDLRQWPIRFYLSPNGIISADDVPIGNGVAQAHEVTPAWSRALTTMWIRIPEGTAPGRYYFGATMDPDAQLPDTMRENNTIRSTLRIGVAVVPSAVVAAPSPLAPADRTEFAPDSTTLRLSWTGVANATLYHVELDHCSQWTDPGWWDACQAWLVWTETVRPDSTWTSGFPPQPGRWRVRGVDQDGMAGPPSAWRTFRFP